MRTASTTILITLLLAVTAGCGASSTSHGADSLVPQSVPEQASQSSEAPRWLPAGAREVADSTSRPRPGRVYALSGRANAQVLPANASTAAAVAAHPATTIRFLTGALGTLTPPIDDPILFVVKDVAIGGQKGTLTEQANGLGDVTLAWSQDDQDFQLITQRLRTPDGTSGVSDADLVHMAESVS